MNKTTLIAIAVGALLLVGAVFASSEFLQEEAEESEVDDNIEQVCNGNTCNQQCGGNCGIPRCGCS